MKGMRDQHGGSLFLTIIFLVMLITLVLEGMILAPAYFTDAKMKRALVTLPERMQEAASSERGGTASSFKNEVKRLMRAYLSINGIHEDEVSMDDLVFKRVTGGVEVSIEYEIRKHMFYNIDVVVSFSDSTVVPEKNES